MKLTSMLLSLALSAFLAMPLHAEEKAAEGEAAGPKVVYVNLYPPIVGNYGSGPKLKYYKADISLRVANEDAKKLVEANEPLLRNQLIMLFAEQTDETLSSVEAKEEVRKKALEQTRHILEQETGAPQVDDLLFNNLIVQP